MTDKGLTATFDNTEAIRTFKKAVEGLDGPRARSLFQALAGTLETETEANFEAQGRPHWVPLSGKTLAERMKRDKGGSVLKILQDSGMLASNIVSYYDEDSAMVGANRKYAAIHQYGGTIDHPGGQRKIRLRTDRKGNLERQGGGGRVVDERISHGAIFAKQGEKGHKQYREQWVTVDAYKTDIPARPYLPFSGAPGSEELQPETEKSLLAVLSRHVLNLF